MAHTMLPPKTYNTNTVFEINDDWDTILKETKKHEAKKPVPLARFSDDPIALSIQSYLIWKSNSHRKWVPVDEVGRVTPEARDMAHALRKYFLHRNTMKILQGQQPTDFQNKMMGLLSDTRALQQDELGILYRLPYLQHRLKYAGWHGVSGEHITRAEPVNSWCRNVIGGFDLWDRVGYDYWFKHEADAVLFALKWSSK